MDASTATHRLMADIDVPRLRFVLDNDGVAKYAYGTDDDDNSLPLRRNGNGWTALTQVQANWHPLALPTSPHVSMAGTASPAARRYWCPATRTASSTACWRQTRYDVDDLQWDWRQGHGFYKDANQIAFYRTLDRILAKQPSSPTTASAGSTPPATPQ
ncbi:hypothetical protein XBLMG947_0614 [Xanthomonas bromi]|uniref:Uncharacterized protein n=1 Tax=Xanthomonas bromi TaxID=56449 RepID=A0A1C3NHF3_9XANT|nr:hypothetical protein XBLMG947_0614 [Xanthomonas bromi]